MSGRVVIVDPPLQKGPGVQDEMNVSLPGDAIDRTQDASPKTAPLASLL
jgi:hypothetical protein